MLSTQPSIRPSTPTTSGTDRRKTTGRVTLEVALVVELVVDVEVDGDGETAKTAARTAALESSARNAWDEVSLAAARALRTELMERDRPLVAGLTISRLAGGESQELLVQHRAEVG